MIRPRGKPSRIYKNIFGLEGKSTKREKNNNSKNKKMNLLQSREFSLNPRARNP
jgi:hypothetical protein